MCMHVKEDWKKGKRNNVHFPTCYILSLSSVVLFHLISEYEYFKQWFMTNRIQKFNCVTCSDYIHILYINISQNPEFQNVEGIWIYILIIFSSFVKMSIILCKIKEEWYIIMYSLIILIELQIHIIAWILKMLAHCLKWEVITCIYK